VYIFGSLIRKACAEGQEEGGCGLPPGQRPGFFDKSVARAGNSFRIYSGGRVFMRVDINVCSPLPIGLAINQMGSNALSL